MGNTIRALHEVVQHILDEMAGMARGLLTR